MQSNQSYECLNTCASCPLAPEWTPDNNFDPDITSVSDYQKLIDRNAPLFSAKFAWHEIAVITHNNKCKDPKCVGLTPMPDLITNVVFIPNPSHQCYIAKECDELVHGTAHGFILIDLGREKLPTYDVDNYVQEDERLTQALADKLNQDVDRGWMHKVSTADFISPLFGIDEVTKVREIKDMSAPKGRAVNDIATVRPHSLPTMEHNLYGHLKPNKFMGKLDVSDAYRNLSIHALVRHMFNFKMWIDKEGNFSATDQGFGQQPVRDRRLMFGARRAGEIFVRLMTLLQQYLNTLIDGLGVTLVYVDDWFVITETEDQCQEAMEILIPVIESLGFKVKPSKTEGPSQDIIFLGFRIQTTYEGQDVRVSVADTKVQKTINVCKTLRDMRAFNPKAIQKTTGFLNHISQVVFAGRSRLQGLYIMTTQALKRGFGFHSHHSYSDLDWWTKAIISDNGTNVIIQQPKMWTKFTAGDASLIAMGAHCEGWWCAYSIVPKTHPKHPKISPDAPKRFGMPFTQSDAATSLPKRLIPSKSNGLINKIAYLELLIIYIAIFENLGKWKGLHIPIYSDN